jgi:hypothetical protein
LGFPSLPAVICSVYRFSARMPRCSPAFHMRIRSSVVPSPKFTRPAPIVLCRHGRYRRHRRHRRYRRHPDVQLSFPPPTFHSASPRTVFMPSAQLQFSSSSAPALAVSLVPHLVVGKSTINRMLLGSSLDFRLPGPSPTHRRTHSSSHRPTNPHLISPHLTFPQRHLTVTAHTDVTPRLPSTHRMLCAQ